MSIVNEKSFELKETRAQQTKQSVTKQAFANLLFVSIAEKLAYFFNPFIDSVITGIFLDEKVQSAIGFFVPITVRQRNTFPRNGGVNGQRSVFLWTCGFG